MAGDNRKDVNELVSLYRSLTDEFQARIRRLGLFVRHPYLEGAAHEAILRDFLRAYLPEPYGVSRGAIWNLATGKSSGECDIVLYDRSSPIVFREADFVVVHPDAAVALVEVRTVLPRDKREWGQIIDKIRRIHGSFSVPEERVLPVFLFTFEVKEPFQKGTVYEIDAELAPINAKDLPDAICVLGKSVLLNPTLSKSRPEIDGQVCLFLYQFGGQEANTFAPQPFMFFFALLMEEIEKRRIHGRRQLIAAIGSLLSPLREKSGQTIDVVLFRISE